MDAMADEPPAKKRKLTHIPFEDISNDEVPEWVKAQAQIETLTEDTAIAESAEARFARVNKEMLRAVTRKDLEQELEGVIQDPDTRRWVARALVNFITGEALTAQAPLLQYCICSSSGLEPLLFYL